MSTPCLVGSTGAVPVSYTHLDVYKRQPRHHFRITVVGEKPYFEEAAEEKVANGHIKSSSNGHSNGHSNGNSNGHTIASNGSNGSEN